MPGRVGDWCQDGLQRREGGGVLWCIVDGGGAGEESEFPAVEGAGRGDDVGASGDLDFADAFEFDGCMGARRVERVEDGACRGVESCAGAVPMSSAWPVRVLPSALRVTRHRTRCGCSRSSSRDSRVAWVSAVGAGFAGAVACVAVSLGRVRGVVSGSTWTVTARWSTRMPRWTRSADWTFRATWRGGTSGSARIRTSRISPAGPMSIRASRTPVIERRSASARSAETLVPAAEPLREIIRDLAGAARRGGACCPRGRMIPGACSAVTELAADPCRVRVAVVAAARLGHENGC